MTAPTLFDDARTVAIRDMVALFRVQLKDAEHALNAKSCCWPSAAGRHSSARSSPANQPANAASHEHLQSLL
ncbi:MAG: hypothetical protein IPI95_01925 [Flavobacteriales bacterium]|nr:hypothetical protein [Flavobacteriales bacterium]